MAAWSFGNITPVTGPKPPKVGKKGSPTLQPAPVAKLAAPAVAGQLVPGKMPETPGGVKAPAPFRFADGQAPWVSTAIAAAAQQKDPAADLSWQDSSYNSTVANLLAQKNQGAASILTAGRRAAEDRSKNKALLGEARGKSKVASTRSANKSGLFYSGTLGKNLGDIDTDFDRRNTDVDTAFARGEEDRAAQDAGLTSSFNAAQQSAAQQAIDRWVNGAQATEAASTPSLDALIAALTLVNAKSNVRGR